MPEREGRVPVNKGEKEKTEKHLRAYAGAVRENSAQAPEPTVPISNW